jgi:S1-C subfamily serine protease
MSHGVVQVYSTTETFDDEFPFRPGVSFTSTGTAFFFDSKVPYLLTCHHVVKDAVHLCITLPKYGKKKFDVEVVSECQLYDIALLKLKTNQQISYQALTLNNKAMKETKVGDKVDAVGFPLSQDNVKVTSGIISGHQFSNYQIDTPVNPGNSGGPLIRDNKVIAIISSGILFTNDIGYAIPIERYLINAELMKKNQEIHPPSYFGWLLQQPPNTKIKKGLYIYDIIKRKSIVHQAQPTLKIGDILLELDGFEVMEQGYLRKEWMNDYVSIQDYLFQVPLKSKIQFKIKRGNSIISGVIPLLKKKSSSTKKTKKKKKPSSSKKPESECTSDYCIVAGTVFVPFKKSNISLLASRIAFNSRFVNINNFDRMKTLMFLLKNYLFNEGSLIMVVNILPGSPFETIFEKYDVIYSVNSKKCNTISQLKNFLYRKSIDKNKILNIKMVSGKSIEVTKRFLEKENEIIRKKYNI